MVGRLFSVGGIFEGTWKPARDSTMENEKSNDDSFALEMRDNCSSADNPGEFSRCAFVGRCVSLEDRPMNK